MPGAHVALPDGRHVWEYMPRRFTGLETTDLVALVKAAAAEVLPDAQLTASEQRAVPGEDARLVTTLTRHPRGASVQVHARIDESFTLVYDALVTRAGSRFGIAGRGWCRCGNRGFKGNGRSNRGSRSGPQRRPPKTRTPKHCRTA